jgi:hypothetical protein
MQEGQVQKDGFDSYRQKLLRTPESRLPSTRKPARHAYRAIGDLRHEPDKRQG